MTRIDLKTWLALLSEAGVDLTSHSYSLEKATQAAQRLELELEDSDRAALHELEEHLSTPAPSLSFLKSSFRHPQSPLQLRQAIPSRHPRDKPTLRPVPVPDPKALPPWGQFDDNLTLTMHEAIIPLDWRTVDGKLPTLDQWAKWFKELVAGISSLIWPTYTEGKWAGIPVGPLLDADFELLTDLRDTHGLPINAMHPSQIQHGDLFTEEDDKRIPFGTGYERYDPTLSAQALKEMPGILSTGIVEKVGTLDLWLKAVFQRPRAWQMALLQDRREYNYTWARTANTPSLVSGHCLQASIAGCTAYLGLFAQNPRDNVASIEVLKQFTMDIGDRRVFAGVHYPSDNLASWYVALNLVPRVFGSAENATLARDFLWDAISNKSPVFGATKTHSANPNSPYRPMVDELEKLGTGRKVKTTPRSKKAAKPPR